MQVDITWYSVENNTGKKIPKHLLTVGVTPEKEIFVPAAIAGDEIQVMACANWDGITIVSDGKHAFVPIEWMMKEQKHTVELCKKIKLRVEEFLNKENGEVA